MDITHRSRPFARIIAVGDITAGGAYLLGPDRWLSSPNFDVLHMLPIPIRAWALLMLVAGVVVIASDGWVGYLLGAATFTVWGLCTAATLPTTATGGGGPLFVLTIAALHYLGLWVRSYRPRTASDAVQPTTERLAAVTAEEGTSVE